MHVDHDSYCMTVTNADIYIHVMAYKLYDMHHSVQLLMSKVVEKTLRLRVGCGPTQHGQNTRRT